jgi:hypothetical protein
MPFCASKPSFSITYRGQRRTIFSTKTGKHSRRLTVIPVTSCAPHLTSSTPLPSFQLAAAEDGRTPDPVSPFTGVRRSPGAATLANGTGRSVKNFFLIDEGPKAPSNSFFSPALDGDPRTHYSQCCKSKPAQINAIRSGDWAGNSRPA